MGAVARPANYKYASGITVLFRTMSKSRKATSTELVLSKPVQKLEITKVQATNKRSRGQKKQARQQRRMDVGSVLGQLGPAARDYAIALRDPFESQPSGLPSFPPLPSQKLITRARGSAAVGSGGFGFVSVYPDLMASSDGYVGLAPVNFSQVAYAGLTVAPLAAGTGTAFANAPWPNAVFSVQALQYRLVAVGLRLKFIGAELDCQGYALPFTHPDNDTLNGYAEADFLKWPQALRDEFSSSRNWVSTTWCPTQPSDLEFKAVIGNSASVRNSMAIAFTGKASSQWVMWEACAIVEYVGTLAPSRTMSVADVEGMNSVLTAAENEPPSYVGSARKAAMRVLSTAYNLAARASGPVADFAGRFAGAAAASAARNAMGGADFLHGQPVPRLYTNGPRITIEEPDAQTKSTSSPQTNTAEARSGTYEAVYIPPTTNSGYRAMMETKLFHSTEEAMAWLNERIASTTVPGTGRIVEHKFGK